MVAIAGALLSSGQAWAAPPATTTNDLGMAFVLIPAGSFMMGAAEGERDARDNEKPRHRVMIGKPFYIATHEVTQAQWQAVTGRSPHDQARSNPFLGLPGMEARIRQPQNPATVSWNDAQAFISQLNRREGHTRYRLPTEAEWEYAARAGTATAYSFGDDVAQLGRYAWYGEDFQTGSSHPVGRKLPNPWGLFDVHGNVWEWVQDWYAPNYGSSEAVADPRGPAGGTERVVRGGSWHVTADGWRSAFRKPYAPDYRGISIGFRVALDPAP